MPFDIVGWFFIPLCAAIGGQPVSTALLPAGHSCTRTAMDKAEFTCNFCSPHKSLCWNNRSRRPGLYLEGGSRAKPGDEVAEKAKGSRKCREHLEGKAPPQAPLLRFPPMHLLAWWHSESLLTSCDRVAACPTTSPCSSVLGERKSGKWRKWVSLKQERQQGTPGSSKPGKPLQTPKRQGIRPSWMRSNTQDKRGTSFFCRAPSLPASPINHSTLCPATFS